MLEGFSGSLRVVTVLASDSINGFNLVRLRRMVGQCHQITPCRHLARHDACVKGLMLEGFSGSRRVVTVLASDSTNGFNLVRLRRMVGRCHHLAPCCRFSRHGHQWARV